MPIDISSILKELATTTVTVRGHTLTLRALKASETMAIDAAWPEPVAPDEAEKKYPAFIAKVEAYFAKRWAIIVGISADIAGPDGSVPPLSADRTAFDLYATHLLNHFTEAEVNNLFKAVQELNAGSTKTAKERIGTAETPGN